MSAPDHTDLQAALDAEHAQRLALQHHAADQAQRVADLEAEIERITEAGRAHIRRAAALEAQLDALAARLATIEAQPPVAWQSRFTDGGGWGYCSERHAQMVAAAPHEWPGYEVRALFARPAPAQRVSAADGLAQAAAPAQVQPKACRDDGRCQYAIDHGAEGLGHCPPGKCVMPREGGAA